MYVKGILGTNYGVRFGQEHPENIVLENDFQFLQFDGRRDAKGAVAGETAIRREDMAVRIEVEEIAEGLDSDNDAGDGVIFRGCRLEKDLQGFPGATAETGKEFPIVKEMSAQDLGNTEDEMAVGNLFEDVRAQPLPEFDDSFLVAGGTEVTACTGESQQVFMAAIFAFHAGKTVVQIAAVQIPVNDLLQIGPPEAVLPGDHWIAPAGWSAQ